VLTSRAHLGRPREGIPNESPSAQSIENHLRTDRQRSQHNEGGKKREIRWNGRVGSEGRETGFSIVERGGGRKRVAITPFIRGKNSWEKV